MLLFSSFPSSTRDEADRVTKITEDKTNDIFQIRLILRKDFSAETKINFEELKLLDQIQQDLNTFVFQEKKCELVICDNKFQTLSTPIPLKPEK